MTDCIVSEYESTDNLSNTTDTRSDTTDTTTDTSDMRSNTNDTTNTTLERTELENLIQIMKKGIEKNEPAVKLIRYPSLLVDALEEMNNLIGMHRLKDSVALQTVQLIERMKSGEKSTAMLNTMLSGPPGVGKSKVGIVLAKIWFALGFLNSGVKTTFTTKKTITENPLPNSGENLTFLALLLVAWGGTYIIQLMSFTYNKIGLFWLGIILGLLILIIFFVYYSSNKTEWIKKYVYQETSEKDIKSLSDRDIISVVSRNDFVGEYLGHTSGKTKKLLEANIGKVLFIDEAYSLINDPRDAYGYECLNTLNLFLSENPDKLVVIFAGYKDQMNSTIFTAQPGLSRRIMWKFECDLYTGDELAEIFFIQANKEGWIISPEDKIKIQKLIIRNESVFKAYGGDTERLLYLSSLESSRSNLTGISESFLSCVYKKDRKKFLTYRDVELGLISLKENKD